MTEAENEPVDYRQIAAVSGALHRSAEEDLARVQAERDAALADIAALRRRVEAVLDLWADGMPAASRSLRAALSTRPACAGLCEGVPCSGTECPPDQVRDHVGAQGDGPVDGPQQPDPREVGDCSCRWMVSGGRQTVVCPGHLALEALDRG